MVYLAPAVAVAMIVVGLIGLCLLDRKSGPTSSSRREIQLTQIAATTVIDQVGRHVIVLYALAASGSVWSLIDGEWRRIEPPTVGRQTL